MPLTEAQIEELKATHGGELHLVQSDAAEFEVVVKAPSRMQYRRFLDASAEPKKRAVAMEDLCADCVVHPANSELRTLLEAKPGAAQTITKHLLALAGVDENAAAKKL